MTVMGHMRCDVLTHRLCMAARVVYHITCYITYNMINRLWMLVVSEACVRSAYGARVSAWCSAVGPGR